MAIKACKECGGQVSSKADQCPHCGAKTKGQGIGCGGVVLVLIFFVVLVNIFGGNSKTISTAKESPPKTHAEIRKERIGSGFSPWDGSHRALEKIIKKSMNDPDSYEHAETTYWDKGDHLVVKTVYRGKNAFGGVVKEWIKAKASLDGTVLDIIEQGR